MPTIAGLKRRGVPPAAVREFVKRIGVAKANSVVDVGMLEFCIREHLNKSAQRRMAVLRPLKVVIENYPEGQVEELEAVNHPDDPAAGTRKISFGRELYIERDDFMENPPKKFFRLSPGNEVRLRYAYFVKCTGVIKDAAGEVVELRCTYDPATKGGNAPDGRKVKATMHWLSAAQSVPAEIRVYNQLFANPSPNAANFAADLNPESLEVLPDARIEPSVAADNSNEVMQFERQGYFVRDRDSAPGKPVFNRTIGLRDTFAKEVGGRGEGREGLRRSGDVGRRIRGRKSRPTTSVSGIMGKWAAAFSKLDAKALASLYSKNAFFFGSNPNLYRGHDGVTAYFTGLPRWSSPSVQFTDIRTAQAAPDLINVAGTAIVCRRAGCRAAGGENHLGDRSRRRRLEDRQPSRLVKDAADRAVGARRSRAPSNPGKCHAWILRAGHRPPHRLIRLWLFGLLGLKGLLPGGPRRFLALVAGLAL